MAETTPRHLTTRRGFIATLGFGGVSLYGLWAAYGAAPTPWTFWNGGHGTTGHTAGSLEAGSLEAGDLEAGGHSGHGGNVSAAERFQSEADAFLRRYRLPDGSVYPHPRATPLVQGSAHTPAGMTDHTGADHTDAGHTDAGHDGGHDTGPGTEHSRHQGVVAGDHHGVASVPTPVPVYFTAAQWQFTPEVLRLEAGAPYQFRMMALDVTHGASLQLGAGSRIIRLRPHSVATLDIVFPRPGTHLVYCTSYCGLAHDAMQGRIIVT